MTCLICTKVNLVFKCVNHVFRILAILSLILFYRDTYGSLSIEDLCTFFHSVSSCLFFLAVFVDILDCTSAPLGTDQQSKEGQKSAPKSTQKAKERDKDKDKLTSKSSSIIEQVSSVYVCVCACILMSVSNPTICLNNLSHNLL